MARATCHSLPGPSVGQNGEVTDSKRPAEQAVELAVFAPIGFALEAKSLLPTFVERGRQQVMMAKMVGRFAVTQGQAVGKRRLSQAQAQAEALLAEFGVGAPAPERSTGADRTAADQNGSRSPVAPTSATSTTPAPASDRVAQSSAASADLAIADYDSLAASHVIPRLAGLDDVELEAVRAYESAHRARKTILGKIAQLQGS